MFVAFRLSGLKSAKGSQPMEMKIQVGNVLTHA